MATGSINVSVENIFPLIKKFLYSDHEIFLRELISNAVDATSKLKVLSQAGEVKGDLGDLRVEIILNPEAGTLTVKDKGIGMTEEYALGGFAKRIVMADHRFGDTDYHLERFIELGANR